MTEKLKCELCEEKIEKDDYGKIPGMIIKVLKDDKNMLKYVCKNCQKEKGQEEVIKEVKGKK